MRTVSVSGVSDDLRGARGFGGLTWRTCACWRDPLARSPCRGRLDPARHGPQSTTVIQGPPQQPIARRGRRVDSANSASLKLVMRTGLAGVRSSECSKPDLLLEQSSARALPAYT